MRIVETFPHEVEERENVWIPLTDGSRLAARMWLPRGARDRPVPAILEYLPYRKRDRTRERDEPMHRWFAGHGYAALRVDLRGSGESDGLLADEYTEREQLDGVEVIDWIARQPWSSGAVGMMGKSWGGFNSLQVAALRPEPLKAVIAVCAADDRYADDAHYMGGCLLNENLIWGSILLTLGAQPPDPELVGERWRAMWRDRLANLPLCLETWLAHPRRDDYWRHGSVCEDYGRIACPVYAIGGWADGYTNAVPRLLAGLRVPAKGLVGPWAHVYPHDGVPGPAIGFLQEALRWWDRWLRGIDNGIMDEPVYRVWMQESAEPRTFYAERPGRWVAEPGWPSPRIETLGFRLGERGLVPEAPGADPEPGETGSFSLRSPQTVGLAAGSWCGFGIEGEMPFDQREDDGRSLTFETAPLEERTEILGAPAVELELSVDRPLALIAARLNDIAPDGASTRVTYGLLNLTHRDGHERPEPLVPGRRYRARVRLNDVAHAFPAGHRLRLALSGTYWPVAWPSPEAVELTVHAGPSRLELPVRPPRPDDHLLRPFEPPETAPGPEVGDLDAGGVRRTIERDLATGETVYATVIDLEPEGRASLTRLEPLGLEFGHAIVERFSIRDDDPLSARAELEQRTVTRRGDWSVRIHTRTRFSATLRAFRLEAELEAYEGEWCTLRRRWERSLPRDGV